MVDGTGRAEACAARRPSAEEWVQLHERLRRIGRECRRLRAQETRAFLAECAPELCGLDIERLLEGGPFGGCATELHGYAAEFLSGLLPEPGEGDRPDRVLEARIRSRVLGFHPKMAELRRTMVRYLGSRLPILLVGDRGTGKGALARASANVINGSRLLTVSLAGVPDSLAESELFGHRKGAFTGAIKDRLGIFHTASNDNGIVYLDDVAECSRGLQAKLLTALEEGIIRAVGSDKEFVIGSGLDRDFRILSSSQPAALNRLRPDLRDRLGALPVWIPALTERGSDILLLADRAARLMADRLAAEPRAFSRTARVAMLRYSWPGNVRQLFSVIMRVIVHRGENTTIHGRQLRTMLDQEDLLASQTDGAPGGEDLTLWHDWPTLEELEGRYIARVMKATNGNVSQAAKLLGIHRTTVHRLRNRRKRE